MFDRVTSICGQHYANILPTSGSATYQIVLLWFRIPIPNPNLNNKP